MPKKSPINTKLPQRWRFRYNKYYFQVPPGDEHIWQGKKEFLLGETFKQAMEKYQDMLLGHDDDWKQYVVNVDDLIKQPPSCHQIYFLFRDDQVVYVGQTNNLGKRVTSHAKEKDFDQVAFIWVPKAHVMQLEAYYIKTLKPEYNHTNVGIL